MADQVKTATEKTYLNRNGICNCCQCHTGFGTRDISCQDHRIRLGVSLVGCHNGIYISLHPLLCHFGLLLRFEAGHSEEVHRRFVCAQRRNAHYFRRGSRLDIKINPAIIQIRFFHPENYGKEELINDTDI